MSFFRCKKKNIKAFADRFRGLADDNLEHVNTTPSLKYGKVLAVTLLHNADFEENTIKSAMLQRISLAEDFVSLSLNLHWIMSRRAVSNSWLKWLGNLTRF